MSPSCRQVVYQAGKGMSSRTCPVISRSSLFNVFFLLCVTRVTPHPVWTFFTPEKPPKVLQSTHSTFGASPFYSSMLEVKGHSVRNGTSVLRASHQFSSLWQARNSIKSYLRIAKQIEWSNHATSLRRS